MEGNPNSGWGIRSRTLRLSEDHYTHASSPKVKVSPAALSVFTGSQRGPLAPARAVALKTWLGLRYDRPAVPEVLVDLARSIAKAVRDTRTAELAGMCHDVLFQATEERPAGFTLIAVVVEDAHVDVVVDWLTQAALAVEPALGQLAQAPEALKKTEVSLDFLENSYVADLSDISWGREHPRGAV